MVSIALSYNALQNNFGFTFEILPTALGTNQKYARGMGMLGPALLSH
jgi:hypothetical protein